MTSASRGRSAIHRWTAEGADDCGRPDLDDHGTERRADTEMTIYYELRPFPAGTWVEALHENPLDPERHAQMEIAWDFLLAPPKDFVEGRSD